MMYETWEMQIFSNQKQNKSQTGDTWSGMLWEDFIAIVIEQGFRIAYQKVISANRQEEEMEAILYCPDGLILYATSFNGTLNKAIIEGEMGDEAFKLVKQTGSRINTYCYNGGSYAFSREVQNDFVQFLEELKEIPIARSWTESHRALNLLNSHEEAAMMQDSEEVKFDKKRAIQIQKLSKCCEEVKRIVAAVLLIPREREVREFMLWDSFLETITRKGFQVGYKNNFVDVDESEQEEVILYRADGLLLYAYSECGCLAKASLYGEIKLRSKKELKRFSEYFEVEANSDGIVAFTRNACVSLNRMLQFLKEFELNPEWTVSKRSLELLNRAEQVSLKASSDKQIQAVLITRTKLLQSYIGIKEIAGVMTKHAAPFFQEQFQVKRNPFYVLRKYCMR